MSRLTFPGAGPLVGGSVKALVIVNRYDHRQTVELAQRLRLDYETVMLTDYKQQVLADSNSHRVDADDPQQLLGEMRKTLARRHNVMIIGFGNLSWQPFVA